MKQTNQDTLNGKNRNGQSKRVWPVIGIVAFLMLLGIGFWPKPTIVETTRVQRGPMHSSIQEEGRTRVRHRYVVSAPVTGQLRRVSWKVGDSIDTTNQVLAVIDPIRPALLDARSRSLAEARRDNVRARIESSRAQHRFAAAELRRVQSLYREKTVSVQELEQAEWRETAASREMASLEAALKEVEAELAEFGANQEGATTTVEIKSPIVGKILRVLEESSRPVSAGTPLIEIGDVNDLEVVIEVLSRDGAVVSPGTEVELDHWGGHKPLKAKVRHVEPTAFTKISALGVEEQRVLVVADIVSPSTERGNLGDQFRVEARIITWSSASALKVPLGAVFRKGDSWRTYALESGRAVQKFLKTGHSSTDSMEVLEGVKEGDELILYPGDKIQSGTSVRRVELTRN